MFRKFFFLSPLLFPSGDQCCDAVACPCSESSSSFLHSSFLQAVNAVMLWPVHVQKVPQDSEHLCPAKLQTSCDLCCACQSICPFIPTDSGMPRAVDPQKSLQPKTCVAVCQSGQPIPDSNFCSRFVESVRTMACVICAPCWEASLLVHRDRSPLLREGEGEAEEGERRGGRCFSRRVRQVIGTLVTGRILAGWGLC